MFERQLAAIWDLFYRDGRGKDYHGESEYVAETVRHRRPGTASLLDVGCGTGEHLATLSKHFEHVEGLDLSASMIEMAREKVPGAGLHVADMRDYDLGRTFDAVVSLNTCVAYLPSPQDLTRALRRMAAHLKPDGVLIVEPWWFPDRFIDGYVAGDVVRGDGRTVTRVSQTRGQGDHARMDIHYLVAGEDGIEHFTETHVFGLWSRERYLKAFEDAGCTAEYVPDVLDCGMFVGGHRR